MRKLTEGTLSSAGKSMPNFELLTLEEQKKLKGGNDGTDGTNPDDPAIIHEDIVDL